MTNRELDAAALQRVCCGNQEAMEWIQIGRCYVHEIDDLVDEDLGGLALLRLSATEVVTSAAELDAIKLRGAMRVCRIGALAIRLFTHPFFLKNLSALRGALIINNLNYRDSVRWEQSEIPWQRNYSDWARHGWLDVCKLVGEICGGYDNIAAETVEMTTVAYTMHHDESGKPT